MCEYGLGFITDSDLKGHVKETLKQYEFALEGYDLAKFNSNLIDPIKLTFDKNVYMVEWEEIIRNELYRQKDKTNSNNIGYFNQNIFKYIDKCIVPKEGFDIIFDQRVYVEMKTKHNTMNSSSSQKTYMRMQNQILNNDSAECYLVEIISKRSGKRIWKTSLDKHSVSNPKIFRVSIDHFLAEVTQDENAFKKLCSVLPKVIEDCLEEMRHDGTFKEDTAYQELLEMNSDIREALFNLAFGDYLGFKKL